MKFIEEFKLIRSILFTYLTYFFSDILYKISVFLIENVSLKRNESFLLNKIINNLLTKMFFCDALVLLFIIKLRFPKGKNIHHIIETCFCSNALIFLDFRNDWYFMISLFKCPGKWNNMWILNIILFPKKIEWTIDVILSNELILFYRKNQCTEDGLNVLQHLRGVKKLLIIILTAYCNKKELFMITWEEKWKLFCCLERICTHTYIQTEFIIFIRGVSELRIRIRGYPREF